MKLEPLTEPLRICGTCDGRGSVEADSKDGEFRLWFSTNSDDDRYVGGHFEKPCPNCKWSGFENATPEQALYSELRERAGVRRDDGWALPICTDQDACHYHEVGGSQQRPCGSNF